ncbi:hypothetical protein Tco_1335752 [Tanacetum coccineum]
MLHCGLWSCNTSPSLLCFFASRIDACSLLSSSRSRLISRASSFCTKSTSAILSVGMPISAGMTAFVSYVNENGVKSHNVIGIAPVAIIDRQLPFEYTIASRSTDVMMEEGKPVGPYVIKMKNYMELERLGYELPQDLSAATPQVMAIQGGRIQKANKKSLNAKGKGLRGARKLKQGDLYLYVGNEVRAQVEAIRNFDLVLLNGLIWMDFRISVSKNNVVYFNAIPSDGIYETDVVSLKILSRTMKARSLIILEMKRDEGGEGDEVVLMAAMRGHGGVMCGGEDDEDDGDVVAA